MRLQVARVKSGSRLLGQPSAEFSAEKQLPPATWVCTSLTARGNTLTHLRPPNRSVPDCASTPVLPQIQNTGTLAAPKQGRLCPLIRRRPPRNTPDMSTFSTTRQRLNSTPDKSWHRLGTYNVCKYVVCPLLPVCGPSQVI